MQEKIKYLINDLQNKKIHIVGLSSSECMNIVFFLCKYGINPQKITAHDFSDTYEEFIKSFNINHIALSKIEKDKKLEFLKELNLKINFKKDYLNDIKSADIIFVSQNWFNYTCNFPYLNDALEMKIPFMTITELYFSLAPCLIIAITGSNGKTTTSNLIYEILKNSSKKAFFTGNDRYAKQILEEIESITALDILVMEISNRQLINFKYSPHIGVITNILPNHIEEHGSFENYIETKFNLFSGQGISDYAVINYDNPITRNFLTRIKAKKFIFSRKTILNDDGIYEKDGNIFAFINNEKMEICSLMDIPIPGEHNVENVMAAIGACFLAGASFLQINEGVKNFKGIKNRLELIRNVNDISYYNDLSSTSPQATVAALRTLENNIILIAGGHDKGIDYDELSNEIKIRVKMLILLPGRGSDKIKNLLTGYDFAFVSSLTEAFDLANKKAKAGDKVLLSPACAGFYSLYINEHEGFNKFVKKIRNN